LSGHKLCPIFGCCHFPANCHKSAIAKNARNPVSATIRANPIFPSSSNCGNHLVAFGIGAEGFWPSCVATLLPQIVEGDQLFATMMGQQFLKIINTLLFMD
jgi:hypothetical protein